MYQKLLMVMKEYLIFKNNKVDLILLDIMMPKIDGITVLETIRTVSNLPIILLTAKGQEEDKTFWL